MKLHTLGGLSVDRRTGAPLTGAARQRRRLALLAVLAAAGPRGVSRDRLVALFWPESDETQARRALNQAIYALRRDMRAEELLTGTSELRINPDVMTSDVGDFLRALEAGDDARAVELYGGPFLDGIHIENAEEFERWTEAERQQLHRRFSEAATRLATAASERGDPREAAEWWRRLAVADPLNSRVAYELMQSLVAVGDVAGALQHARVHSALLESQLGISADQLVVELVDRLRAQHAVDGGAAAEGRRPSPPPGAPIQPTVVATLPPAPPAPPAVAEPVREPVREPGREPRETRVRIAPRSVAAAVLLGVALVAAAWALFRRERLTLPDGVALDDDLIAVAPFAALEPELELWREGMVDILSRHLDGAGPLRTVSPTTVVRTWEGRPDVASATQLGRRTGARVVVIGHLLGAGRDSVRAEVSVVDADSGVELGAIERREAVSRMDLLSDSLTVDVLRQLNARQPVGAIRRSTVPVARSLDALKAFLRGEQAYRRSQWDSAQVYYERAVEHDPTFTLALRRLGNVLSWRRVVMDSLSVAYLLRAGAGNRGLAARDSLLVAADSLDAAINALSPDDPRGELVGFRLTRRLLSTLDAASRRYSDDAEVWLAVGEARYHFGVGPAVGVSERVALEAFDRAIALDSALAPAYIHTVELGLNVGGLSLARHYARAYLARNPTEAPHRGVRLVAALLEPGGAGSPEVSRLLDTLPPEVVASARTILRRWPDSTEIAVRLTRLLAAAGRRPAEVALFNDRAYLSRRLAEQLAFRGHAGAAYMTLGTRGVPAFAEVALLGGVPAADAAAELGRWLRAGSERARLALRWWAERGDTTSLRAFLAAARARARAPRAGDPDRPLRAGYDTLAALAHLALAAGDSAGALGLLRQLPDTVCPSCFVDRLTRAQLMAASGDREGALTTLREPLAAFLTPVEVLFALERGRVAERLGLTREAADAYRFAAAAWANGDPALRARAAEARAAMRRLHAER
ncbi:MAG TPA: BTAD domain-containing putative transcriptional regulator [Gemmatimonadaceae bacterium]|nr:BTAD domain-containing putative transcriptional regulator [Gemmatimonadaceae bacterium]